MGVRRASALAAKASAAPQWEKRRVRREGQRRVQRTSGAAQCSASSATTHAREAQHAAVAGAGGGLALIGVVWVASLARVSDLNVVTGAGAFLTMFAGAIMAVTSKKILLEFRRNKTYDDAEVAV